MHCPVTCVTCEFVSLWKYKEMDRLCKDKLPFSRSVVESVRIDSGSTQADPRRKKAV